MNEDPTFLRQAIRAYRHAFAELLDASRDRSVVRVSEVGRIVQDCQRRLEAVKRAFPEQALDPDELRERNGIADLRRFG